MKIAPGLPALPTLPDRAKSLPVTMSRLRRGPLVRIGAHSRPPPVSMESDVMSTPGQVVLPPPVMRMLPSKNQILPVAVGQPLPDMLQYFSLALPLPPALGLPQPT